LTGITFDPSGSISFPSEFDGEVKLLKSTWEGHLVNRPERASLKFNFEKIPTTLVIPDKVRESLSDGPDVHLYYKEFPTWKLSEDITLPTTDDYKNFVVVVDVKKKIIKTIYETGKAKPGKIVK